MASIDLSVGDTSMRFRDSLIVRATPKAALGFPVARVVTWISVITVTQQGSLAPVLTVHPLAPNGDSARIIAQRLGTGEIRARAGDVTTSFRVIVQESVFKLKVTHVEVRAP